MLHFENNCLWFVKSFVKMFIKGNALQGRCHNEWFEKSKSTCVSSAAVNEKLPKTDSLKLQ